MVKTSDDMQPACGNTCFCQSSSMLVQEHKTRNIFDVVMEKLGEPSLILRVSEDKTDPLGVPCFQLEHEIKQGVAEPALGGVELDDGRFLPARQGRGEGSVLRLPLLLPRQGCRRLRSARTGDGDVGGGGGAPGCGGGGLEEVVGERAEIVQGFEEPGGVEGSARIGCLGAWVGIPRPLPAEKRWLGSGSHFSFPVADDGHRFLAATSTLLPEKSALDAEGRKSGPGA